MTTKTVQMTDNARRDCIRWLAGGVVGGVVALWAPSSQAAEATCPALLQHTVPRLQDEKPQSLCQYQGRVLLVVNTASRCGFTDQYEGLEALHQRYQGRGLVVLGFPSNDFGRQEPGSNQDIADFCDNQFGVKFPMFTKTTVKGEQAHPFYRGLAAASDSTPRWNFHKYLVARDGRTVTAYGSRVQPDDDDLVAAIERALAAGGTPSAAGRDKAVTK
ncbi:glutathione peroxidase [Aquabacterium sp. A3]|uniref:glutathione peroxidase n=1 Tax=Aquabacterium sp. A3 TaxID=3132829 RepID=UPI00311955FB